MPSPMPNRVASMNATNPARQHSMSRLLTVAAASVLFALVPPSGPAQAENAEQPAVEALRQVPLTDQQVAGFIAAQKDLQPLSNKLLEGGEKPDDALLNELEEIAKKHGFKSFAEMEEVGANISIVLDGLDRTTGTYTDPIEKMKAELESIKGDTTISDADKKLVIDDLNIEIAAAKPLAHPGNIDVVKKHQAELEKLIADVAPEDTGGEPSTEEQPKKDPQ
ncbi:MAG: hypothetical protein NW216_09795 [Hyphomicrobium sp.]|nr:hypothetical protein [Hyphomicrobium sp.]